MRSLVVKADVASGARKKSVAVMGFTADSSVATVGCECDCG
ncbi:hypothetical protein [Mycobacterium xenopi]|nr:hypothetical protein [Mycobacterium xenopi]